MLYAFCFLGEFGYELFNWQGLVRKFRHTLTNGEKIAACSRMGMDIWYDVADYYLDISEVKLFKKSIASMYSAYNNIDNIDFAPEFEDELKYALHCHIVSQLNIKYGIEEKNIRLVFSSDKTFINGIKFGPWEDTVDIYAGESHTYNEYQQISIDRPDLRTKIENSLNFSLDDAYILVQDRKRDIVIRSTTTIEKKSLIQNLAQVAPVILLDFDTGRAHDSKSALHQSKSCLHYYATSSKEQAILIQHASACVFLTEGDFGSHIYVPPFMGKDVFAIAPADIYQIGTTPLEFWNTSIFRFGGKIIPYESEALMTDSENLNDFCEFLSKKIAAQKFFQGVEERAQNVNFDDYYLWPRTPRTPHHQDKILQRVGACDFEVNNPRSRTYNIITIIQKLITRGKVKKSFVLADLCAGDGIVGMEVKRAFPKSEIIIQDCLKDEFETHATAKTIGVRIYGGFLQQIIEQNMTKQIDFMLMLNTYRGWRNADLHQNEQDLPFHVDTFLKKNAKFLIVTATVEQIKDLKMSGRDLKIIGKGEDDSHMICIENHS